MIAAVGLCLLTTWLHLPDDDDALSLADLSAYALALNAPASGPAAPVEFRDLWDRAETYRGTRVSVKGKLRRVFRQGAVGSFPPLVEAWALTPRGDPFCLVFPDPAGPLPALGAEVRFSGTYLKRVRYQGGDVARLAPLVVGPATPVAVTPVTPIAAPRGPVLGWPAGLILCGLVALTLFRQHLRMPIRRRPDLDPPPRFVDESGPVDA